MLFWQTYDLETNALAQMATVSFVRVVRGKDLVDSWKSFCKVKLLILIFVDLKVTKH